MIYKRFLYTFDPIQLNFCDPIPGIEIKAANINQARKILAGAVLYPGNWIKVKKEKLFEVRF